MDIYKKTYWERSFLEKLCLLEDAILGEKVTESGAEDEVAPEQTHFLRKKKKGTGLGYAGKLVYSCVGACIFCGGYFKMPGLCRCYLTEKERHLSTSSTASRQSTGPACGGRELLSPASKRCLQTWKRDISGDTGNHHP